MTTQERLRALAPIMRMTPRYMHNGVFVDELLLRAAKEMDEAAQLLLTYANYNIKREEDIEMLKRLIEKKDAALNACSHTMIDCVEKMRIAQEAMYCSDREAGLAGHAAGQASLARGTPE